MPFDYKHSAKEAYTDFEFVRYFSESDHSIVKCFPKTGRTHQLRVHLQYLGYPIANDQKYGGDIINSGDPNQFKRADFMNTNLDNDATNQKLFVILWLHAFKYTYKDITVETKAPEWT